MSKILMGYGYHIARPLSTVVRQCWGKVHCFLFFPIEPYHWAQDVATLPLQSSQRKLTETLTAMSLFCQLQHMWSTLRFSLACVPYAKITGKEYMTYAAAIHQGTCFGLWGTFILCYLWLMIILRLVVHMTNGDMLRFLKTLIVEWHLKLVVTAGLIFFSLCTSLIIFLFFTLSLDEVKDKKRKGGCSYVPHHRIRIITEWIL